MQNVHEKSLQTRILSIMLIVVLTFTNIALLGIYLSRGGVAYATTNLPSGEISNVEFSVHFDRNNRDRNTASADITSEDLVLYATVRVVGRRSLKPSESDFWARRNKFYNRWAEVHIDLGE